MVIKKTTIKTNPNKNVKYMCVLISNGCLLEILTWSEFPTLHCRCSETFFLHIFSENTSYHMMWTVIRHFIQLSFSSAQHFFRLILRFLLLSRLRVIRLSPNQKILLNPSCFLMYFGFLNLYNVLWKPNLESYV